MNKQIHRVLTLWDVIKPKCMHWLNRFQGTVPWDSNLERSKTNALVTSFIQLAPCEVSDHVKFLDLFMDHPLPLFRQAYGFTTKTRTFLLPLPLFRKWWKETTFLTLRFRGSRKYETTGRPGQRRMANLFRHLKIFSLSSIPSCFGKTLNSRTWAYVLLHS